MSDDRSVVERMADEMQSHFSEDIVRRREAIMATLLATAPPADDDEMDEVVARARLWADAIMEAARE